MSAVSDFHTDRRSRGVEEALLEGRLMSAATLHVEASTAGRRRSGDQGWDLPLLAVERTTLRELIRRVVEHELRAFVERNEARSVAHVMTRDQIADGAAAGRVEPGGKAVPLPALDPATEVARAYLAFEDGLYFVFVDQDQVESLDEQVILRPGGSVQFLRLVPLAGG